VRVTRLAIVSTHAIQYQAPLFRAISSNPGIDLEVLFCHNATPKEQAAAGFGVEFHWDVSLFDGYRYRFLKNVAAQPTVAGFWGLDTPELTKLIQQKRYDAVIINGWHYKSAWQAMRACWKTETPVMARGDSHLHTERPAAKRLAKWPFYRWFIPKLDACLPVGKWSRDYFLNYGARPDRVFIVPHVVDTKFFSSATTMLLPQKSHLRAQWNLREDSVVFLFAGKFIEKKRPMDFVRAVDTAAKQLESISGLMVGDGPLRAECEEFVKEQNAPIRFTGFLNQSQIAAAYVAADALLLPSDGETWGLIVNEAMACGLPCIVSDRVGCGPDMIVPHETGEIFPLGDIGRLTNLLVAIASDQNQLATMTGLSRKKAEEYSVESAVDSVVAAVSAVCSKKR
jgi:glycosyltransferase involved in cell wall biosynthesis